MNEPITVTTDSAIELVTLQDAKDFLRIDHNDENARIDSLRKAARRWCETYVQQSFFTKTLTLNLDYFPSDDKPIYLRRGPVQSVTSLKYYDTNNSQQTWNSSNYFVDTSSEVGRIYADNVSYPDLYDRPNAIEVIYVAGYSDIDDVPLDFKEAVLHLIAEWYEVRGNVIVGAQVNEHSTTKAILDQYRINYSIE